MASTNKTATLELSQFIDTDKPAWLTDYNNDMEKIDTYSKELKEATDELKAKVEEDEHTQDDRYDAIMTAINTIDNSITGLTTSLAQLTARITVNEQNITNLQTQMGVVLQDITDIKNGVYLNNGVITTAMLADRSITTQKIATNAVTTDEILNGTIQYEDLSSTDCLPDIKAYVLA